MVSPELKVLRFASDDVIATSSWPHLTSTMPFQTIGSEVREATGNSSYTADWYKFWPDDSTPGTVDMTAGFEEMDEYALYSGNFYAFYDKETERWYTTDVYPYQCEGTYLVDLNRNTATPSN